MYQIVPAVLVKDERTFVEKISDPGIRCLAELYQIDVLDGTMFHATSWAEANIAATYQPLPDIELHLMVEDPLPIIKAWKQSVESVKRAIVHAEIPQSLEELIASIHDLDLEAGIALNPETSIDDVRNILPNVDVILIMGVNPGMSGQAFLGESILQKIRTLHHEYPNLLIAVDGGITQNNAQAILEAGAKQLCTSSAIWGSTNPKDAFTALMTLL